MLNAERLVLTAVLTAFTSGVIVALVVGRLRHLDDRTYDLKLVGNAIALGLLVVVLVAVSFVAGYAALERRWDFIVVAWSLLGLGVVLYKDTARPSSSSSDEG